MRKPFKMLLCSLVVSSLIPLYQGSASAASNPFSGTGTPKYTGGDGWALTSGGTTGGSSAAAENVSVVTNRKQLVDALGGTNAAANDTSKIIYVKGTIDMNVDDDNKPVGLEYYADPAYDFDAYLAAYDPKGEWGYNKVPSGLQEDARKKSQLNQAARIQIRVGSNTSIIGLGTDAKIIHGNMLLDKRPDGGVVDNIIVTNIEFQDAYDYFPQWDGTDGDEGNWNSMYDMITVKNATHVWIDHCTFNDGDSPDSQQGTYYGREYQHHDGAIDVTNAANLVTISNNYIHDHDKTMLIGSSDSGNTAAGDKGKLKVTIHHNYFENAIQRLPRVRFGQAHVYNNYYKNIGNYVIGRGVSAQVFSEANYFENASKIVGEYDKKEPGYAIDKGSIAVDSTQGSDWTSAEVWNEKVNWNPGENYTYSTISANQVKDRVRAEAGTLKGKGFADLNGHWAKDDVEWLASRKLVTGITDVNFAPQNRITRAEFASFLVRSLGVTEATYNNYSDVKAGDLYEGAIGAASKAGFIDGFENGTFQPNAHITREDMAVMISRALKAAGKSVNANSEDLNEFSDSGKISAKSLAAVAQVVKAGIIKGVSDNTFAPGKEATRVEAAVMLSRFVLFAGLVK